MSTEADALKALASIEKKLATSVQKKGAKGLDLGAICKQYKAIKPLLETALPLIEKIPVYGAKIAAAIRFLMKIADVACPIA